MWSQQLKKPSGIIEYYLVEFYNESMHATLITNAAISDSVG